VCPFDFFFLKTVGVRVVQGVGHNSVSSISDLSKCPNASCQTVAFA
jgi:hypothetical protein